VATINLRAYADASIPQTDAGMLQVRDIFAGTRQADQTSRRRFGRSLSMDRIEVALQAAFRGSMTDITDILSETVDTDPHLGSILNKRFRSIAALPFEVQPATGFGIDRAKAMFYAEVVRTQIRNMKSFRRNLSQLAWGLFNGRACLEKNWIRLDVGAGPVSPQFGQPVLAVSDMEWIHPRRLTFGSQRELRVQDDRPVSGNFTSSGISVLDYPDKFVWWLPQLFNEYPEREGLGLRCMYWSFFKRFAARERMVLTELYGKPWRIAEVDPDSQAGDAELKAADAIIDNLGSSHTARLPRGIKLNVVSPIKSAGEVHSDIISESDAQNSKLVLGQTGTTDGVPSGLNNNQANVMQDEQLGVLIQDAGMVSEVIESMLTDRIIAVNFGESEVTHAPTFRLRADLPSDRKAELERLKAALDAGLTIDRNEAYEVSGFSQPEEGAVVLRIEQPPTPPNSPVAPAVRPVFVYPVGQTPDTGEQQLPPPVVGYEAGGDQISSAAVSVAVAQNTITVNEDRKARGLGPLMTPEGTEDPRGYLIVSEFQALIAQAYAPEPTSEDSPSSLDSTSEVDAEGEDVGLPGEPTSPLLNSKIVAAYDVNMDADYETPFGDGGAHMHTVRRQLEATSIDGHHYHVFKIKDSYVLTQMDGAHGHALPSVDANSTLLDGDHQHAVILPNGVTLLTEDDGQHAHELQIVTTTVDGTHVHVLKAPGDSGNPAGYSYTSMTASELAGDIAKGLVPASLFQVVDQMATQSVMPTLVQATSKVQATAELMKRIRVQLVDQPTTANGTPDDFVSKGMRELTSETSLWASIFEDEVEGELSPFGLYNALMRARVRMNVAKFGRALERAKMHSLMLGVVDSVREVSGVDDLEKVDSAAVDSVTDVMTEDGATLSRVGITRVTLAKIVLSDSTPFSKKPFKSALTFFKDLKVLDKASFEKASAAVKQRSFTVAGIVGDQMLQTLQADLFSALKSGEDLNDFKKRIRTRLRDAGFLSQVGDLKTGQPALNASHIETVFRTNTLNTYNTGRYIHQSSPTVMQAFPVWQIIAVKDSRTRETHAAAGGQMLLANDAFWKTAYPPFGWNCRCRVLPRSKKYLSQVVPGSTIVGLPDTGFVSGRGSLATG
jgi:SPP1 gp7 family putative phage head morphogenesis protein